MKKLIFLFLLFPTLLFGQWNKIVLGYGSISGSTITINGNGFANYLTNGQQITAHIYNNPVSDSEEIALITYNSSPNTFTVNSIVINYYGGTSAVTFPDTNVVVRYEYPFPVADGGTGVRSGGGGGSGTVTSVAISGNNGIGITSGSPITTSGTIALKINNGGIGDSSLASTFYKSLSGENYLTASSSALTAHAVDLSGTNATGILAAGRFPALTGDVTTSSGALGTTIASNAITTSKINANAVTYAKMQAESGSSLLLGSSSTTTAVQEITLGTGLSMSGTTLSASGSVSGANPTASLGLSAINGSAGTFMRSDGAPALDVTIVPTWTGIHNFQNNAIGITSTDELVIANNTASTVSVTQQWSPRLRFHGSAWKSAVTTASQTVDWVIEAQNITNSGAASGNLVFKQSINGGAYANALVLPSGGSLQGLAYWNSGGVLGTSAPLGSGTGSQVLLGTASAPYWQQSNQLFYSITNGRLGLGSAMVASPSFPLHVYTTDATTNIVTDLSCIDHTSSGTPTAGFGSGLLWTLKSSTTVQQNAGRIAFAWDTATHATRSSKMTISGVTSGGAIRVWANLKNVGQSVNANLVLSDTTTANASIGRATLSGGTVTVNTTYVKSNSFIFLTDETTGALTNVGSLTVGTKTANTSFVVNSTNPLDASGFVWHIINQ